MGLIFFFFIVSPLKKNYGTGHLKIHFDNKHPLIHHIKFKYLLIMTHWAFLNIIFSVDRDDFALHIIQANNFSLHSKTPYLTGIFKHHRPEFKKISRIFEN